MKDIRYGANLRETHSKSRTTEPQQVGAYKKAYFNAKNLTFLFSDKL